MITLADPRSGFGLSKTFAHAAEMASPVRYKSSSPVCDRNPRSIDHLLNRLF